MFVRNNGPNISQGNIPNTITPLIQGNVYAYFPVHVRVSSSQSNVPAVIETPQKR